MSRELLILAKAGNRRGEIISIGDAGKQWGAEELNTDKFVIAEIDDDETDFLVTYETGEQELGEPDPETGVPTVIKLTAKKYSCPDAKVDEILAADGRKSIVIGDLTDNEG